MHCTEDVHLHMPALRIGTHFLLTLDTVVFPFHLLSATSKPFSSLFTRLAHAARLGLFYKNALYKFTDYGRPLSVSRRPCYILPMFFFIIFFMAALFSGLGERRFAKVLHVVDLECH